MYAYVSALTSLTRILVVVEARASVTRHLALAYLALSAIHSLATWSISPLLVIPFRLAVEQVVYCATLSETFETVTVGLARLCAAILVLYASIVKLAERLHPENFKPLPALLRESAKPPHRLFRSMYSPNPSIVAIRHAFLLDIANFSHLIFSISSTTIAAVAGFSINELILPRLDLDLRDLGFLLSFIVPFIVAEVCGIAAGLSLARDLPSLWVYRVYAIDTSHFIRDLLLKYSTYISEALLALSAFEAAISSNSSLLIYPALAFPLTLLTSALLITVLIFIASRRRVVKHAPTGFYLLEDLAMMAVFIVIMPSVMISNISFKALLSIVEEWLLALATLPSTAVSALLTLLLPIPLARIAEHLDLAS